MLAFDTNYLIRHLVQDHPKQAKIVREVIDTEVEAGNPILIPDIVLCESLWVLRGNYGASRPDLVRTLRALEAEPIFTFEDPSRIKRAIDAFESGKADFADYLIVEISRVSGRQLLTFDRILKKEVG